MTKKSTTLAAPASASADSEAMAWEAPAYRGVKRFTSDRLYRLYSPEVQAFYKPFKCANCLDTPKEAPVATERDPMNALDWAEYFRMQEALKGPKGYETWQDAATDERIRRVKAEKALNAAQKATPVAPQPELLLSDAEIDGIDLRAVGAASESGESWIRAFARVIEAAVIAKQAAVLQAAPVAAEPKGEGS